MSEIIERVPRKIRKTLKKHDVGISETVRKMLERHLEEPESEDVTGRLEASHERLGGKIQPSVIARLVREDMERFVTLRERL